MSQSTVLEPPAPVDEDPTPSWRRVLRRKVVLTGSLAAVVVAAVTLSATGVGRSHHKAAPSTVQEQLQNGTYGSVVVMGPQAMEGDLKLNATDLLKAGFDFTVPGAHPDDQITFFSPSWTFPYTCTNGAQGGTLTVNGPTQTYNVPANNTAWWPSGDQHDASTFQGSTPTNNSVCGGGQIRLQKGGTFTVTLNSTTPSKINIRWHYSAHGSAGGWSGTATANPGTDCYENCP